MRLSAQQQKQLAAFRQQKQHTSFRQRAALGYVLGYRFQDVSLTGP